MVLWLSVPRQLLVLRFLFSLKFGIFMASLPKRNLSKRLPNWPNSVTVTGISISELFVFKTSPITSSPDNVMRVPFSVCPFLQNFSFSPSRNQILLSFFWLVCDFVLEEAFEEMTYTSKPMRLRGVLQTWSPRR